jgi:GntR family transcriptional regulator
MLPSEDELARQLGVSMGTMRKALDHLEDERLVVRRQGRGTSVVDQSSAAMLNRFHSLVDESGRPIGGEIEVVRQTARQADTAEQERLQVGASEMVLRSERLWHVQGRPLMYEEASLALARLPGLDAAGVGDYRLVALAQRCGVRLVSAQEEVRIARATPAAAGHLGIERGMPLLQLDRVVLADGEQPVEWRTGLCHLPDKASYIALMK